MNFTLEALDQVIETTGAAYAEAKEALYNKSTWSEEDEDRLNSCIEAIEACYKWDGMVNWLKSLRPQNRWKPTEEQLRELRNVFDASIGAWDEDVLESLYNDLIKL